MTNEETKSQSRVAPLKAGADGQDLPQSDARVQSPLSSVESVLVGRAVKNMRIYGYPHCAKDNILTDMVYRQFFASMLESNKGSGADIDAAIDSLLARIEASAEAKP